MKVSEKQRPNYYEWNGIFIKGKKKLPVSFFKDKTNIPQHPKLEDLKSHFAIVCFKGDRKISVYHDTSILPKSDEIYTSFKGGKFYLCKLVKNEYERIISNPKKVGKPRFYLIKGQDIYSGNLREHFKGMVMDSIKQSYLPYVKDIPVIDEYPIKIECELHDTIKNPYDKTKELGQAWDIDNYTYPYMKAFPDLLVALKKLRNDDRLHFPNNIPVKFVPIQDHHNRKFVFTISKDERPEISDDEVFKTFHSKAGYFVNKDTGETEDNELRDLNFDEPMDLIDLKIKTQIPL